MDSTVDADVVLMSRLAEGDDVALSEIISRWRGRVAGFLVRMVGDHATAMDLTQETFVRLYARRQSYRPTAAFSTYLLHIAANLARSHGRWKSRHPAVPLLNEDGTFVHEPADPRLSPNDAAVLHERETLVWKAVAGLPAELRAALLLFTVENMSHAEIAGTLGCSTKAVEVRIYRARQLLKDRVAGLID